MWPAIFEGYDLGRRLAGCDPRHRWCCWRKHGEVLLLNGAEKTYDAHAAWGLFEAAQG